MTDIVTGHGPPAATPVASELVDAAIAADGEWISFELPGDKHPTSLITSVKHYVAAAFAEISVRKGTIYIRVVGRD